MYCGRCGKEISDNSKFCTFCGKSITPRTPQEQPQQAAPAPTPVYEQPAAPVYGQPAAAAYSQPQPAQEYRTPVKAVPRDGTGKYILKRLIFFGIAIVLGIVLSIVLMNSLWSRAGQIIQGSPVETNLIISRTGSTLTLIIIPLVIAFAAGILAGIAHSNAARNVIRIVSAVLRSLLPFALGGYGLIYLFGIKLRILPIYAIDSGVSLIMPLITLTVPLAGFFMNAAADNGRKPGFAGGVSAVAAFAADKMPVIILAEMFAEVIFSVPGISTLSMNMLMTRASGGAAIMIIYVVLAYVLKMVCDIIAAVTAKGDPSPKGYMLTKGSSSGRGLLIAGLILAAIMIACAAALPFTASHSIAEMDAGKILLSPGQGGALLGTDSMGRDFYTQLVYALRNTVIVAAVNTIIAVIFGAAFGLLMGFLKGAAAEIFKGITYIFGHGTFIALMLFLLIRSLTVMPFIIVGLFGWGSIAERTAGAIRNRKATGKKPSIVPVIRAIVQTFCSAVIWTSGITVLGIGITNPGFPTIGYLIMSGSVMLSRYSHLIMWPAAVLTILLVCFYILESGLAARERRSE